MFDRFVTELKALDLSRMGMDGLRDTAAGVKRVRAALDALEARLLAKAADRTFDPAAGIELMRGAGGCSQREARRRNRRAQTLDKMPAVADALAGGDITAEHADALVRAAETTSAETVDTDGGLLEKTKALPADLAAREVADWTSRHQAAEDREAKFRRQRAMRSHRTWDDADGMVNFRTRLDPVTGAQARAVFDDISNRLYKADGGRDAKPDQICTWDQRNADAFAAALGINPIPSTDPHSSAEPPSTNPGRGAGAPGRGVARGTASAPSPAPTAPVTEPAGRNNPQQHMTGPAVWNRPGPSLRNQILVIAHTDAITGADPDARCEISGTGPIPRSELERLACESELFGALFSRNGLPLWHGRRVRTVTPQQWRMLIARDRGCVLCAAGPSYCHAHHIVAWTAPAEGPTDIDNLVLVCNRHHHHIHQYNLTLIRQPDGQWATSTSERPRAVHPARKPANRDPARGNGHALVAGPLASIRAGP